MELTVLLDEVEWQFRALSREVERKPLSRTVQLPVALKRAVDAWLLELRQFVSE